ncbi:tyrosine-type recombinase/integrase [Aurantimonas coralicida]|uniref:tyrosine-type recombinase/integrase n=1 Tax=Aurantimonas coralicida TaxID=182270 RepID=UPI001E5D9E03|nr:site-specific integrase [Aurantimonas coralicida]MCD1642475.1 site-specific integrase [Aurantimonas coralicida]
MATITKRRWQTKGETKEAWVLSYIDREGRRHRSQFARKRDAEAHRITVEGQIKANTYTTSKATVADAVKAYSDHLEVRHASGHRVATGYFRNTVAQLDTYVVPALGPLPLATLTRGNIAGFRDKMLANGVSVLTARKVLGSLSRTLSHAAERDEIAANPAKGVRVIGADDQATGRVTPPSRETLALLVRHADADTSLRIRFAAATGLRASEQWALQWQDIDFDKKEVQVRRTVDIYGTVREQTKSKAGRRTVPLADGICAELAAIRGDPTAWVFIGPRGAFTRHTNFTRRVWKPLLAKAASGASGSTPFEPIGWHALRHFAISTWVLAGINMKAVQTLAGHSSFQMTADRYSHLLPDETPHAALNKIAAGLPQGA